MEKVKRIFLSIVIIAFNIYVIYSIFANGFEATIYNAFKVVVGILLLTLIIAVNMGLYQAWKSRTKEVKE